MVFLLLPGEISVLAAAVPASAAAGAEANSCGVYELTTRNGFGVSIADAAEVYAAGDTGIYGYVAREGSGVNIAGGKVYGTID